MKLCIDLRFSKSNEGKFLLEARWQPIQFSGTYALQLAGEPTDWEFVESIAEIVAPEITKEELLAPVEEVTSVLVSEEEQEAKKTQAKKAPKNV